MDTKRSAMRNRATEAEINAEEANERYADHLSHLIDQHLGDKSGEAVDELKRSLAIAVYQFRNPDDTFRKQGNSDSNEDGDEDF